MAVLLRRTSLLEGGTISITNASAETWTGLNTSCCLCLGLLALLAEDLLDPFLAGAWRGGALSKSFGIGLGGLTVTVGNNSAGSSAWSSERASDGSVPGRDLGLLSSYTISLWNRLFSSVSSNGRVIGHWSGNS